MLYRNTFYNMSFGLRYGHILFYMVQPGWNLRIHLREKIYSIYAVKQHEITVKFQPLLILTVGSNLHQRRDT